MKAKTKRQLRKVTRKAERAVVTTRTTVMKSGARALKSASIVAANAASDAGIVLRKASTATKEAVIKASKKPRVRVAAAALAVAGTAAAVTVAARRRGRSR